MPFIRTAVKRGSSPEQKQAIVDGVHQALVASIGMPIDELFNLVSEYQPENFYYDRRFNSISRSDNLVVIEITMRRGRSDAMKKTLYANIAANLEMLGRISQRTFSYSRTKTTILTGQLATVSSRWRSFSREGQTSDRPCASVHFFG